MFHSLAPPAIPLFSDFAAPGLFSQGSIRSRLANRTRNVHSWFLSDHKQGYRARKSTSLAPAGLRWKEMQIAQCASASRKLPGKMGTGWRMLEINNNSGEPPVSTALQNSVDGGNGQFDGVLEPGNMHKREDPGTTEAVGASSKLRGGGNLATGPVLRGGKLQMSSIRNKSESTNTQNLQHQPLSGKYQAITTIPLTGPTKRRRPPINIKWGTPKWSSPDTAASRSRSNVCLESEEKRLFEDLPPLSPQVSPRTVPSSPTETLNPSSTLWQHTLQVGISLPMGTPTDELPRSPPISPPPRRSSLEQNRDRKLTKQKKDTTSLGKFNPKLRSQQAPQRTSSLDFTCRGGIVRASVFSEDIDPGFKKTQPEKEATCSPGNTIRKTRKAVGRALTLTGLISWREREQDDKEEGRAWKEGSIRHKFGRTRKLKLSEDSYPSPPPSPHPGNRVDIPRSSSTGVSMAMNVCGTREVQASEAMDDGAEAEAMLKGKRITGFMRKG